MEKIVRQCLATCLLLAVVIGFGLLLFRFARPMADTIYDLSASVAEGQRVAADKGWAVFTQQGDTKTALGPNGIGGFEGLSAPGQTFYFSRVVVEDLPDATLRLGTVNRTVAVYLDGELLYTDCPEQGGGIGTLNLPMLEYDRNEPVLVTLPDGYTGKTLTIAQSTSPDGGEKQTPDTTAWPCDVTLYCGYAYESALIAESFQAAIPGVLLLVLGVLLLGLFLLSLWRDKPDISLLCMALTALLYMVWVTYQAGYAWHYTLHLPLDLVSLCRLYALAALLVFLALRAGHWRGVVWAATALHGMRCLWDIAAPLWGRQVIIGTQSGLAALLGLLAAAALGMIFWRTESSFYRLFAPLTLAGIAVYAAWVAVSPWVAPQWWVNWCLQCELAFLHFGFGYFLWPLMTLSVGTAAAAVLVVFVQQETERRTEARLLADRAALAQANYENLRAHDEEVMMLRHDMANHLKTLRGMADPAQVGQLSAYLDTLIGQNEKIRPVIQSGNKMLDILLNGKLGPVAGKIRIEVQRAEAPAVLGVADADLSSLVLNTLDNAITAADRAETPFISIDLHSKNNFFVFVCENACAAPASTPEKPRHGHGLGLKIMQQTVERYNGLITAEQSECRYKLSIALPVMQA